jgi:hypothetical protein
MDWKYLTTTVIALAALFLSWLAKRDVRRANDTVKDYKERIEKYEYYPILSIGLRADKNKICVVLTNTSKSNAAPEFKIDFTLRISAGGQYSVNEERYACSGTMLRPLETRDIYPDQINTLINDSLSFLVKVPKEKTNFVVRAHVEYSAPHPKSEKSHESVTGKFYYDKSTDSLALEAA